MRSVALLPKLRTHARIQFGYTPCSNQCGDKIAVYLVVKPVRARRHLAGTEKATT